MKTPEEIKKELAEHSAFLKEKFGDCLGTPIFDYVLTYIQQLEADKPDITRFNALRSKVFKAIAAQLINDSHCKSYEGTFEVVMGWPNYFEDEQMTAQPWVHIILHCYVLGPARHYEWKGRTFAEALDKAEKEITGWIDSEAEQ